MKLWVLLQCWWLGCTNPGQGGTCNRCKRHWDEFPGDLIP